MISYQCKYLSTINYTSKPLLRQTSAVVSKQRTENSNPIPNSCIPSPVSESPVSESPVSCLDGEIGLF
ncbi:MAG: hypothetical protein EWV41_01890 [Microcystis wesenbergii Mw_MB_S_20031200_S109]|nr:MAG: hypothetical protein EWV41_01890 [Microcystis wesenbergii Mw_MB_S_20031200_S109]